MENEVITSIISGASAILATTIPSIVALWSAKRLIKKQQFQKDLIIAYKDLLYMNELERQFIENNKDRIDVGMKNTMHARTREMLNGYYKSDKGQTSFIERYLQKYDVN